jgi:glycosyltransferase involved in cell wall biosynthesis
MEDGQKEATTILVTPVWKDSARLAVFGQDLARELARRQSPIRWIIADDGSGPKEVESLQKLAASFSQIHPHVRVHPASRHAGKGAVVREAWALEPEADWLAFVDADGSVSAPDMLDLIERASATGESTFAVRRNTETTRVRESPFRWLRHHGFLFACRLLLGIRSHDTQCGAKVVKGADFRTIEDRLIEPGWAFDAEMLAELHQAGLSWREHPVSWVRKGGSRICGVSDALKMLMSLFRIRARLGRDSAIDPASPA